MLDEVQLIKNMTEKHWETIFNIKRLGSIYRNQSSEISIFSVVAVDLNQLVNLHP